MSKKREELQDELQRIEARMLRPRGPGAKENKPTLDDSQNLNDSQHGLDSQHQEGVKQEDGTKKRDKFAMDDDKDESDDDRHDEVVVKDEQLDKDVIKEIVAKGDKGKKHYNGSYTHCSFYRLSQSS